MKSKKQLSESSTIELLSGLNAKEVAEQIAKGHVNKVTTAPERSIKDIIKSNFLTPFNMLNLGLFILVLIAGKPLHATFVSVVLFNTLIGTFQEVRAKHKLDQLAVLNIEDAIVLRDGQLQTLAVSDIVLGDVIKYDAGKQIMVDGVVCGNQAEVDEALLTGEADAIVKKIGDDVHGGTIVVAGSIFVRATKVGDDVYANKLASEAKNFSLAKSELTRAINQIIKFISGLIVPIGLALLFTQIFGSGSTWQDAIVNAVAGIVGMIPEGLMLLTSMAFMVGSITLSRKHLLVQELAAIESLARVDVLCLDKTGTLTKGTLKFSELTYVNGVHEADVAEALGGIAYYLPAANATQLALQEQYEITSWEAINVVPFSSSQKWSGVSFDAHGSWLLGAPDVLCGKELGRYGPVIERQQALGNRVLALAYSDERLHDNVLPDNITLQAILVFEDVIRPSAKTTLSYFREQGVDIKIISGDHPKTLRAIADKVGLPQAAVAIDAKTLPEDIGQLQVIVKENNIFGRVSPQQKQDIIKALQANAHVVGMTGDGVNDVLALKQADCSIAMANGSQASRTVAQLVLMNSDFATLPSVVAEGRKVINNIERVASLYLVKTMYSFMLSLLFIVLMKPYPFSPIQLTVISTLMVGIPTFFLALEANTAKVSGDFLDNVFKHTVPAAITITLAVISVYTLASMLGATQMQRQTMSYIVLGILQFFILCRVAKPWKLWKIVLLSSLLVCFIISCLNAWLMGLLGLTHLLNEQLLVVVGIIIIFVLFYRYSRQKIQVLYERNKERVMNFLKK
jgi:cation-transporting ATPase E